MAAEIRILHGGALGDQWKGLPASERMDHFRRKLDLEIDAAEHLRDKPELGAADRAEVKRMLDDLYHHKPASLDQNWAEDSFSPVPAFVDTGSSLIDKSNIAAFEAANQSMNSNR